MRQAIARTKPRAVDQVSPHNLEAERSVLGAILIDNDTYHVAAAILDGRAFFRDAHRCIFERMADLWRRAEPIDLVSVKVELERSGDLEDVGGPAYIGSLVDGVPRSINVEYYAKTVRDMATRRQLLKVSATLDAGARSDDDLAGLVERVSAAATEAVGGSSHGAQAEWRLIDDAQLLNEPDPEPLIDGVLFRRGLTIIYSPPGTGKTTLAALLAVSIATKRPLFGHQVRHQGSVCYIGPDDPAGWKPRLITAKQEYGLDLADSIGVFLFPEPFDLLDDAKVTALIAFLVAQPWPAPLEAVIVDTFAAVTPGANENAAEDLTRAMVNAKRLSDGVQAAVIICHHTNAAGSRERGHSAMRGAADTMLALVPSDDIVRLECNKQRNGSQFEALTLKLVETPDGCVFRLLQDVAPTTVLTPAQQKALDALRDTFSADGATKSEWQRTCSDIQERTFHRAAKRLQDLGLVRQSGPRFMVVAGTDTGTDATDKALPCHRTDSLTLSIGPVSSVTCQDRAGVAGPRLVAGGRS